MEPYLNSCPKFISKNWILSLIAALYLARRRRGDGDDNKEHGAVFLPRVKELKLLRFNILIIYAEGYGGFAPRKVPPTAWK